MPLNLSYAALQMAKKNRQICPQPSGLFYIRRRFLSGRWTFLTTIHPVIGYSNEWIDIYLAQDLSPGKSHLDYGEKLHVIQMTPQELIEKVRAGEVSDVKTQIGCFWLDKVLNKDWQP